MLLKLEGIVAVKAGARLSLNEATPSFESAEFPAEEQVVSLSHSIRTALPVVGERLSTYRKHA